MKPVALFLAFFLFVSCVVIALADAMRRGRMTLLNWTILGVGGVYGAGWMVVLWVTETGGNPTWYPWIVPNSEFYPVHTAAAFLLLAGIWVGWSAYLILFGGEPYERGKILPAWDRWLATGLWLLFCVAVLSQWFYAKAYGGFLGVLDYSQAVRSGIFLLDNPLSFLHPIGGVAIFSSFGFFGLWLSGFRRPAIVLGCILSFIFSVYILYSWRGRMGFLVYLSTFLLGFMLYCKPKPLALLIGGGAFLLGLLGGAYLISVWFNIKPAENLAVFAARELSFPFGSFFVQLARGELLFRGFVDFLYSPLYVLPSSWWTHWVEDVSQINTALIMGAPKGEEGVTGSIPLDLLTLGLMQMHLAGVAAVGALFGALLRLLQSILDRIDNPGVRSVFEAYVVLQIAILGIFYSQPSLFVSGNFGLLFSAIFLWLFVNIRRFRWSSPRHGAVNSQKT